MIEFKNVSKSYQDLKVLDKISFDIPEGQTFVLLGESGSGKTTVLKLINRLVEPEEGDIFINRKSISDGKDYELRRRIGYAIQDVGLFPHMNISENISTVPRLVGWDKEKIKERVRRLVNRVGLDESCLERYPNDLSGGQRQRVGLARALAVDPEILLMDEPFGALDPITKSEMHQLFISLEVLRSKTIVLVTHDISEAVKLGDIICLMDKGEILQVGTPRELLFAPKSDKVNAFFHSVRSELEFDVLQLQDLNLYLNQVSFPFNKYPLPPNISVSSLLVNLERSQASNDDIEKVYSAFLKARATKKGGAV